MSLYERITSRDSRDIFYYENISINPIEKPSKAWSFINEYFKLGEKEKAFDLDFFKELKARGKHIHTVSMYYIGCLLNGLVEDKLSNSLSVLIPRFGQDFNYKFLYSWFLTCLYHDTAYVIENEGYIGNIKNGCSNWIFNEFLRKLEIENNVYNHNWTGVKHYTYKWDLIESYFYYCFQKRKSIDHGIIGGFVLYDRLVKNYNNTWEKHRANKLEGESFECFNTQNLSWRLQHLDHFAYVANAIISHNVWYSKNKALYERYGLEQLIEAPEKKIKLQHEPLLFFLAIIDTIEPTKFFNTIDPQYVWKSIDISMDIDNSNKIIIKILDSFLWFDKWAEKIKSLESWLDVKIIAMKAERKITITVNE